MGTLTQDLRHSFRLLRKHPGYTLITVLVFALAIGANTAVFSVVNTVLLRPLAYHDPDRLVVALHEGSYPVSPADFFDYRNSSTSFSGMAAAQAWGGTLTGGDKPERMPGLAVSANMMDVLGVKPLLGRSFLAGEDRSGAQKVVLLSFGLWRSRFGGDRSIVGRTLRFDDVPYTVAGVMPESFRFAPFWATRAQVWVPLDLDKRVADRGGRSLRIFARLKAGVPLEQAQAEMSSIAKRLEQAYPQTNAKLGIAVVPLHEKVVSQVKPTLLVLFGAVAFVLLIACANIGSLSLSRAIERRKEVALRTALGASAGRLVQMVLTEMLLIAAAGSAVGLALAQAAVEGIGLLLPPATLPRQSELSLDTAAVLFCAAVTAGGALIAGLVPALQVSRGHLSGSLKESSRGTTEGSRGLRLRSFLVGAEVAFSLVLLAGAGLMMRTMVALQRVDAGFDPHNVLTMQVSLAGTRYDKPGLRQSAFAEVRERLSATPGVESASAINHLPIGGDIWRLEYTVEGRPVPRVGEETSAAYRVIMPGYFKTMSIGVVRGRDFTAADSAQSMGVAVVNETLARRCWPGEDPIGKAIHFGVSSDDRQQPLTVVGVVRNARQNDWTAPAEDEIYLPYAQRPDTFGLSYLTFVLKTRVKPETVAGAAADAVGGFSQSLPVSDVASMERVVADALWRPRLASALIGGFAAAALLLAVVGVYGVIAHAVRRRTQEIGIRIALGARPGTVIAQVFREGMKPVWLGGAAGIAGAATLTRYMQSLLFDVKPGDPLTLASVSMLFLLVAAAASFVPALRAARVDPLTALRGD